MLGGSHGQVVEHAGDVERERLNRQSMILVADELAFLRRVGVSPGMRVLDLGCGTGVMSGIMAAELDVDVVGLDANPALLPASQPHPRTSFAVGDAYDLMAHHGAFDAVTIRFMLQHISDPARVARQVHQALRPGGVVVVIDSDDAFTLVSPPDAEFTDLLMAAQRRQAALGGDRQIGRRLTGLLTGVGFEAGAEWVRVITAREVGFDVLFALVTGCKAAMLGDSAAFTSVHRRLGPGAAAGSIFFSAGVVAASARRPGCGGCAQRSTIEDAP